MPLCLAPKPFPPAPRALLRNPCLLPPLALLLQAKPKLEVLSKKDRHELVKVLMVWGPPPGRHPSPHLTSPHLTRWVQYTSQHIPQLLGHASYQVGTPHQLGAPPTTIPPTLAGFACFRV